MHNEIKLISMILMGHTGLVNSINTEEWVCTGQCWPSTLTDACLPLLLATAVPSQSWWCGHQGYTHWACKDTWLDTASPSGAGNHAGKGQESEWALLRDKGACHLYDIYFSHHRRERFGTAMASTGMFVKAKSHELNLPHAKTPIRELKSNFPHSQLTTATRAPVCVNWCNL